MRRLPVQSLPINLMSGLHNSSQLYYGQNSTANSSLYLNYNQIFSSNYSPQREGMITNR